MDWVIFVLLLPNGFDNRRFSQVPIGSDDGGIGPPLASMCWSPSSKNASTARSVSTQYYGFQAYPSLKKCL